MNIYCYGYFVIWAPELASLQEWTWKTVFLIVITSASRVSEIQSVDCRQKTKELRKHHNLFVFYACNHLGFSVSSQTISRWIPDLICHAYRKADIQIPRATISAHSTRAVATTLADIRGVSPRDLCSAALWANSNVFAKFYRLDMVSGKSILLRCCLLLCFSSHSLYFCFCFCSISAVHGASVRGRLFSPQYF